MTGENTEEKRYKTKNLIESMSSINVLLKEICDGMIKKKDLQTIGNNDMEENLDEINDNTDNIEEAKIWALSQKQNFVKT